MDFAGLRFICYHNFVANNFHCVYDAARLETYQNIFVELSSTIYEYVVWPVPTYRDN